MLCVAGDRWSLSHVGGGGDSALESSSVTSVAADRNTYSLVCDGRDHTVIDDDHHTEQSTTARLQRLHMASSRRHCDDDGDDDCYRTLADIVTAGAYQISRPTILSY